MTREMKKILEKMSSTNSTVPANDSVFKKLKDAGYIDIYGSSGPFCYYAITDLGREALKKEKQKV